MSARKGRPGCREYVLPKFACTAIAMFAVRSFCFCSCFFFYRLRRGPFEASATVKPPAVPRDTYCVSKRSLSPCLLEENRN